MSLGKVLKKVGAGFLVTLIESAKDKLSIEYNIVVCISIFYPKKKNIFCGFSFFIFKKISRLEWGAGI